MMMLAEPFSPTWTSSGCTDRFADSHERGDMQTAPDGKFSRQFCYSSLLADVSLAIAYR